LIYLGVYYRDTFSIIAAKTGYGKSLTALVIATMRRVFSIMEVPLLGLGSDQVTKTIRVDKNIEAYHVDEFCGEKARELKQQIVNITEDERYYLSVILFMSPRKLKCDSEWMPLLESLAHKGFILFICVDEAHSVNLHDGGFRPNFWSQWSASRTCTICCLTHAPVL
jgi:superfamily II DNA helicase RecQ